MTRPTVELLELPIPEEPERRAAFLKERRAALRRQAWDQFAARWGRRAGAVGNWCYGGAVKAVQFPAYALDLLDRHGKPDYSKLCPFLVCQELVGICAWDVIRNDRPLQSSIVLIIAVLSFASATLMREFLAHVRAKYAGSDRTESVSAKAAQTVTLRFVDGVPAESNPPVPGATLYAGD